MNTSVIPDAALLQHIAVLGKTGSGKSYAVRGAAVEPLLERGERVCVIDPTGAWHGLRSSATGKSAGFPVVIFGGQHADLPLTVSHGETIADAIGTTTTPSIIDTSLMRVGERTKFFADFADAIVRKNRGPLHLVVDEAHLFMPQGKVNDPQSGAMLHAANNMVSLGRSRGLRIILITQRPAKLHKDALTQAETLIAMRLIAPQDRAAVEAWIEDNADESKAREIISSLATLKTGQGWIWAPELGVLERVSFPRIRTYDSGRAPDGSEGEAAKVLAPIDRDAIAEKLKAVVDEAKANDPKALRQKIAELERKLATPAVAAPASKEHVEDAYNRGLRAGQMAAEIVVDRVRARLERVHTQASTLADEVGQDCAELTTLRQRLAITPAKPAPNIPRIIPAPVKQPSQFVELRKSQDADAGLTRAAERKVLTVLAQYPLGRTVRQVAILAGYAMGGGGFRNAVGRMRALGYLEGEAGSLNITQAGIDALGHYDPLPTGRALAEHWLRQLDRKAEREVLQALLDAYPNALTPDAIAAATPTKYEPNGGGFRNALGKLRTLELVTGRGELRASEELFNG